MTTTTAEGDDPRGSTRGFAAVRVCLLGFTIPDAALDAVVTVDRHLPSQTHNFAWSLVDALGKAGLQVRLLSVWPVSNFPRNPRIVFRSAPFETKGVLGECLGFVNIIGLKHVTRFLQCLTRGTRVLRRWRPTVLLVHGVHSPFLWYAAIGRRLLGLTVVVILTDPPGVRLPTDRLAVRLLKWLDIKLVRWALRWSDAVIALTTDLARDFAPGKPALVIDGIGQFDGDAEHVRNDRTQPTVVYAGSLRASYGVDRLVDAVSGLTDPPATLEVYGSGELAGWVSEVAAEQTQIEGPRLLSREDLLRAYRSADLLVQPRPTNQSFVRYSFPSKMIEYMASGTPVLTTRLVSVTEEYTPYVYWIDDDSPAGIRKALRDVLQLPKDERLNKGRRAAKYIRATRSSEAQGKRISAFLQTLNQKAPSRPGRNFRRAPSAPH
jgi:glycosyltransferase involved in cell wall biosynthesis